MITNSKHEGQQKENTEQKAVIADHDRDSLHTLSLNQLPFELPALRRARLIKNARLDSVVELFQGRETGSGQLYINELAAALDWPAEESFPDKSILDSLARLASYDVYSLRISLRELNIPIGDVTYLQLSEAKIQQLTEYMTTFTGPLMQQVYGKQDLKVESYDDLVGLFRNADIADARQNLEAMAENLRIDLAAVPKFIEDYGDVFLSLSYYRNCLDQIRPQIESFLLAILEMRSNQVLLADKSLMKACDDLEDVVTRVTKSIEARFRDFDQKTQDMWENVSADSFRETERMIKNYHVAIGGVLCALTVKMHAWQSWFPMADSGSPMKRAEFIRSEMRQGLDKMRPME